jgi:hypothetical protein
LRHHPHVAGPARGRRPPSRDRRAPLRSTA